MFPEYYEMSGVKYRVVNRDNFVRKDDGEFAEFEIGVIFVWKCNGYCVGYHLDSEAGTYYKADIVLSETDGKLYGVGKTDNQKTDDNLSLIESALFDLSVSEYCYNLYKNPPMTS